MKTYELLRECFEHFYHLDQSNAAVHCAAVRYSPITFRLAEEIETQADAANRHITFPRDHLLGGDDIDHNVRAVLNARGEYPEDVGR